MDLSSKSSHVRKRKRKKLTIDTLRNDEIGSTIGDVPIQSSINTTKSVNGGKLNNR